MAGHLRQRCRPNVAHLVLGAFAVVAALASPVRATDGLLLPAHITAPPAQLSDVHAAIVTEAATMDAQELRVRHEYKHMHRRADKEDAKEDEDTDEDKETNSGKEKKTSDDTKSDEETKTADDDEDESDKETKSVAPTKIVSADPDDIATRPLSVASSASPTSIDPDSPLPTPFDGTAASEFRTADGDDSCPDYISRLLSSPTFNDCFPLSMLVTKSDSFFEARRQLTSMVRVLDASCGADVDSCGAFMNTAARNLTAKENCQEEYKQGVTVVIDAYYGLINYEVMYAATCLQDPDTDQYCYAGALTNHTNTSDRYLYSLPYNLSLPASSNPTCSWCNQETLDIFHAAAADRSLPISKTYEEAARIVNNLCDPDWVNGTLPEAVSHAAPAALAPLAMLGLGMLLLF
ncbi:uncharacterized protein F5Z01DRAFT_160907 [Emericellopsis atlantica]|uniref:DUF7729 domain-containing protein n=1 Tax=Emericellopsis atlantica TaxID=2614577 RepID=A0A9P7ZKB6_9HYPO|nr:uncharacterized protein F5Z01DRAFT_160907 [Emericellopsis atlantica]KAG9253281.1 hypothetical protein F5Z01DRAFT_160907 [Emericellopsis atlantica]